MDAKWEGKIPWSARGNRANDIQALWFTSLTVAAELAALSGDEAGQQKFTAMAEKVQGAFNRLFWDSRLNLMADRIEDDDTQDFRCRPNQLMTLTVPFDQDLVPAETGAHVVKNTVNELLFPWGICSLSQQDHWFHHTMTAGTNTIRMRLTITEQSGDGMPGSPYLPCFNMGKKNWLTS